MFQAKNKTVAKDAMYFINDDKGDGDNDDDYGRKRLRADTAN